jgi:hypothetical protein
MTICKGKKMRIGGSRNRTARLSTDQIDQGERERERAGEDTGREGKRVC